jgi:Arginine deiminase
VTINPMTKPARVPETMIMETVYRFHPMYAAEQFPIWLGGSMRTGAAAMSRAGMCSRSATAR